VHVVENWDDLGSWGRDGVWVLARRRIVEWRNATAKGWVVG